MLRVLLVRHGESTWNAERRWQGSADPPLSTVGEQQAVAAGRALRLLAPEAAEPTAVLCSTLRRAQRTAELLDVGTPDVHDWLRERAAGEWEGLTRADIDEAYPGYLADHRRPPGFEVDDHLLLRLNDGFRTLVGRPGPMVAVSHGGVIGALERQAGMEWERIPNLGGRWFRLDRDGVPEPDGPRVVLADADAPPDPSYA